MNLKIKQVSQRKKEKKRKNINTELKIEGNDTLWSGVNKSCVLLRHQKLYPALAENLKFV